MKLLTITCCFFSAMWSQSFDPDKVESFTLIVDQFYSDSLAKNQLSITTSIPFDRLSFQKADATKFKAEYEVSIAVYSENEKLLYTDFRRKTEYTDAYRFTNSNRLKTSATFNVNFEPGNYLIKGQIRDIQGGKIYSKNLPYKISTIKKENLYLSNLAIYELADGVKTISNDQIFNDQRGSISVEFRAYKNTNDSLWYTVIAKNSDNKVLFTKVLEKFNFDADDFVHVSVEIPKDRLNDSQVELTVQAKIKSKVIDELKTRLRFQWNAFPLNKKDMKIALEQMMYVMSLDSIDYYSDSSLKESQEYFKRFWISQSRVHTLDDGISLMKEYFKRVAFANKYFSSFQQANTGWKSDMGRIYIKFGPPDDIVKDEYIDPYRKTRLPRITWSYFKMRERFYFYDRTGFNDYELDTRSKELENRL
ncbi:MAG: GWxTD domain-containing protein [Calditrichaeota bacterium]|nr:GWxTD domain-containing protein [Calditrichota bacterium]